MVERLVVIGAGGFGRETLDVAEAINAASANGQVWEIVGVADDAPSDVNLERLAARSVTFLGSIADLPSDVHVVIGVGSPQARSAITQKLDETAQFTTLIHPTAVTGSQVTIGAGSVVCAGVSVGTNVTVGEQVHLNPHAVIGHDTSLGDFVSVNPNATISGDCTIDSGVLVGAAAVVLQGLRLAPNVLVGAAACVTKPVTQACTLVGVPARRVPTSNV